MNRPSPLGLASASLLALALMLPSPVAAQIENVHEIVLDNGLTFLLYQRPGDPNVAVGWTAHVGSANESPGITGLAHLFEHMMFKGTHTIGTKDIDADLKIMKQLDEIRSEMQAEQAKLAHAERRGEIADASLPEARTLRHQELIDEFDALLKAQKELIKDNEFDKLYTEAGGTGMNAFTSHDITAYFVNVPANKLELWCWLESDRLTNPVFRQFYSERDVVNEERRMRTDSTPTGRLDEEFEALFWKASPYSWPVIGWPSDLDTITREEALAFYERNYSPNNLTAAIVGDFEVDEAEKLVRKYFSRIKRSKHEPTPVRTFEPGNEGVRRLEGEAETRPTIRVRWTGPVQGHVDEPALNTMVELLNGKTGRLYKSLVEDQQIASDASARLDARKYGGFIQLTGVAAEGHTPEQVEQALYKEIERLANEPVGERELQKVKNQSIADNSRRLNSNFLVMIQLLIYDAMNDWKDMFTETDKALAVTAEDVQRVAKNWFPMETRTIATYRTKETGEEVDPLWAALTSQQQMMAGQIKAQMKGITTAEQAEQTLGAMAAQASQVPEEVKPVFAWAESYLSKLAEKLKTEGGAS